MGATGQWPLQNLIERFGVETWILGNEPTTHFPYCDHTYETSPVEFPDVNYTPDPRATQLMYSYQNSDIGVSDIRYEIVKDTPQGDDLYADININFYRMVSDEKVYLEYCSIEESVFNRLHNVNTSSFNFYVVINPMTKEITSMGIAELLTYTNQNEDEFYTYVLSTPITNQAVFNALSSGMVVRELPGYYGSYSEILESSDNFKITSLPAEYLNKYIYSAEHNKFSETVCTPGTDELDYAHGAAFKAIQLQTDLWYDPQYTNYILMRELAVYINGDGGGSLGSDILRRTSTGNFTNGVDLDQSECVMTSAHSEESIINFTGGYLRLFMDGSSYANSYKYIALYNANGQELGRCQVGYKNGDNVGATYIERNSYCSVYLVHDGGHFYLYALAQFSQLYDDDGNLINFRQSAKDYNQACFFQKIYAFGDEANAILEGASKVVYDTDPTYQPEDSEEASLPDNMSDVYDRDSIWETGDEAGENKGVRYTGDSNVNPTDLQKTVAEDIPGGHQPVEDPATQGHIPTEINCEMVNILAPTEAQMLSFASDIRSDTFLQAITNYFSNPMDIVISAHTCIAPTLNNGSDKYLQYGLWTSNYTMKALKQKYYKVSMGELNIMEYTASFADYPPYSNYVMYLPYIGFRQIDGNHIVGRNLKLYYYFDVATGEILAELLYKDMASGKGCPIGYYSGNTLARFPLKSVDYSSIISNAISGVFSTASAIGQFATGNVAGGVMSMVGSASKMLSGGGLSPDVNINGTVSGSLAYSMYDTPFLIRTAPHLYNMLPYGYKHFKGMPSNTGTELGNVLKMQSEYIQFDNIDLDGIVNQAGDGATQIEKEEILRLLQQGVFTK